MATTTTAKATKGLATTRLVPLDEELWFGSTDNSAQEDAAAKSMAATAGAVLGAKPFPESVRRLAELSSQENPKIPEIVAVLEQDPALSAKLLRVVNSAGFGLRQRCTSVRHAVTLVGSKHLHQMATTAAVLDLFDAASGPAVVVLEHSAVVGALCRYLGAHQGLSTEDLFTAGILHDIGKLMLLETFGDGYRDIFDRCAEQPELLYAAERAEYGFDHGVLAAHVLKVWNIPNPVPKVVAWHHEPTRAYASSQLHGSLVQTVRLADALTHAFEKGATRANLGAIAQHESASYLDISEAQLDAMWDDLANLRDKTLRQRRGGVDADEPGDNESAARVKSPQQREEPAETPKQFPCVQCGSPGFGTACPACKGYLCASHPIGAAGWCSLCAAQYADFVATARVPVSLLRGASAAGLLTVGSAVVGYLAGDGNGMVRGLVAGLVASVLGAAAAVVVNRASVRARFVRTRPDRTRAVG